MNTISKALIPLFLAATLISCSGTQSMPEAEQTEGAETALAAAGTMVVETQTAQSAPQASPTYDLTPTAIPGPYTIAITTPDPRQPAYIDPDGWYYIYLPADMKSTDTPNAFSRQGAFFETGYLPKFGYMSNVLNVCAWVANVELEPEQSVVDWSYAFSSTYKLEPKCSVFTNDAVWNDVRWQNIKYDIFENPAADPDHRFVYIMSGWNYESVVTGRIPTVGLSWMRPVTPRQEPVLAPLTSEEISLWGKTAPILQGASVTEYTLPPGLDPSQQMLLEYVPEEAFPSFLRDKSDFPVSSKTPTVEEQLKPLGYELRVVSEVNPYRAQLFRDGRVLFDYVSGVSDVYRFTTDTGAITAFVVTTVKMDPLHGPRDFQSFLIQNDAINAWEFNHQDPPSVPILYENEILWLKAARDFGHVQVLKSNRDVVYSFAVFTEPLYAVSRFAAWDGHWVLSARDFLIQDGEILNEKLGFEEIFSWGLIDNKPVYLFRKGPRIGISYDGKILPLEYQDVARYRCCGYAINNPMIDHDSIHFFGKRDGAWYYVVVEFM